jgi:hypothetical protein
MCLVKDYVGVYWLIFVSVKVQHHGATLPVSAGLNDWRGHVARANAARGVGARRLKQRDSTTRFPSQSGHGGP